MKVLKLYYPEERARLPREDAWAVDEKNGLFVVADGVHLLKGIEYGNKYPRPSPAGKLAREFCGNFLKSARRTNLQRAFSLANRSVFHLNRNRKRSETFSRAEAYYAATGAFGRIKKNTLEWGYICDSSITVLSASGKTLFSRTEHKHYNQFDPILSNYSSLDASYMLRTIFRNALSSRGEKLGYGVITGERSAERYAWFGKRKLHKGEIVVFATDGFERYLQEGVFRSALISFDRQNAEAAMAQLKKAHRHDGGFIVEKTLVAVRCD